MILCQNTKNSQTTMIGAKHRNISLLVRIFWYACSTNELLPSVYQHLHRLMSSYKLSLVENADIL